ncbi:MAG: GtrA family protein [Clostridia bacterium]|nr:GtrA family protein [Clostridia bacterium]
MDKIKEIVIKYKEFVLYAVFGVVTTLANFFAFLLSDFILGPDYYLISNAIAWIVGVVVAFVTNKLWVFNSKSWKLRVFLKEFSEFVGARLFSFGVEEAGMWLFVDVIGFDEKSLNIFGFVITGVWIVKILLSVIVVILNYFFSKFIIFKKKKAE